MPIEPAAYISIPVTISDAGITLGKIAPIESGTALARISNGTGSPEEVSFADLKTALDLTKLDVGLGNIDNTTDANKPVSMPQQSALDGKQDIATLPETVRDTVAAFVTPGANIAVTHDELGDTLTVALNLANGSVTLSQMEGIATGVVIARTASGSGAPEAITFSELKTAMGIDDLDAGSIKTLYESNTNTNAYSDAEKSKLAGLESSHYRGTYADLTALQTAYSDADPGDYADVDGGVGSSVVRYIWDDDDDRWSEQIGESTAETASSVKTKYESNPDTNAYSDAEKAKLVAVEAGATADQSASEIESAYNSQVAQVSGPEIAAGTETEVRRFSPADVSASVAADSSVTEKLMKANGIGVLVHDADDAVARPTGYAAVHWYGTVVPANMAVNDLFIDLT